MYLIVITTWVFSAAFTALWFWNPLITVVYDAQMGSSQSDCRKKSRDGLSTNQIAGFGGVVKQDGGRENCVTKKCHVGCHALPNKSEIQEVMTKYFY